MENIMYKELIRIGRAVTNKSLPEKFYEKEMWTLFFLIYKKTNLMV